MRVSVSGDGASVEEIGERTADDVLGYLPGRDHPSIPWIYFGVLLTVGWWRYAEGLGYIVQRLAACRNAATGSRPDCLRGRNSKCGNISPRETGGCFTINVTLL